MKRTLIQVTIALVLLAVGFAGGRLYQHARSGYHFKILKEQEFQSPGGPIHWSCFSESIGFSFLDPGTTMIEYRGRTIYKAQRVFQESIPFAQNITASDNFIAWDDGELSFRLTVDDLKKQDRIKKAQDTSN